MKAAKSNARPDTSPASTVAKPGRWAPTETPTHRLPPGKQDLAENVPSFYGLRSIFGKAEWHTAKKPVPPKELLGAISDAHSYQNTRFRDVPRKQKRAEIKSLQHPETIREEPTMPKPMVPGPESLRYPPPRRGSITPPDRHHCFALPSTACLSLKYPPPLTRAVQCPRPCARVQSRLCPCLKAHPIHRRPTGALQRPHPEGPVSEFIHKYTLGPRIVYAYKPALVLHHGIKLQPKRIMPPTKLPSLDTKMLPHMSSDHATLSCQELLLHGKAM